MADLEHFFLYFNYLSIAYTNAPCAAIRRKLGEAEIWPRCDDQGYFEPLQCEPSINECRCVDKLGNVIPGSRRKSLIPQCYKQDAEGKKTSVYAS